MRAHPFLHLVMLFSLLSMAACGSDGTADDDGDAKVHDPDASPGGPCTPRTCQMLSKPGAPACGVLDDGCGGTLDCDADGQGSICSDPFGVLKCAADTDGVKRCLHTNADACTPLTKDVACDGACGEVSDGCEGTIQCGGCDGGQHCNAGVCSDSACTPIDADTACAGKCGRVSDGCSSGYDCGADNGGATCAGYDYCGAGGVPNECGCSSSVTCEDLGFTCGLAKDTCGVPMSCWGEGQSSCPEGQACIGNPASCQGFDPEDYCVGPLCEFIPWDCPSNSLTRLSGVLTTPDGELTVPNALVYIPRDPNAALPVLPTGPSCDRCEDQNAELGPVLAGATTDFDGNFTLSGQIPVGTPFKIVVKSGKWRRVFEMELPANAACSSSDVPAAEARLPARSNDGLAGTQLPKIAIATGYADAMECVFYKMGVDESEFVGSAGNGSIHLYERNGATLCRSGRSEATCHNVSGNTDCSRPECVASADGCHECSRTNCAWFSEDCANEEPMFSATELPRRIDDYDLVIWDCEGSSNNDFRTQRVNGNGTPRRWQALESYVNRGGRFFASHYSVDWLKAGDDNSLEDSANWRSSIGSSNSGTGVLSIGRPRANTARIRTFARWLHANDAVNVSFNDSGEPTSGEFDILYPRDTVNSVNSGSEEWVYRSVDNNSRPQQFSFNTPYGASSANACGRVTVSGFHVAGSNTPGRGYFPGHCGAGELSPQEKILAYMLFDLAACISDGEDIEPPECTALPHDFLCGEGACGEVPDGCGGLYDCGTQPMTCAELEAECGYPSDGCGGFATCGSCPPNHVCGADYKCIEVNYGPG